MITLTQLMNDFKTNLLHIRKSPRIVPHIEIKPKIIIENNNFISPEMNTYIHKKVLKSFTFIDNDATIVLYTYNSLDSSTEFMYSCYVYIKSVVNICKKYSEIKCASPKICIYMTPFLKEIGNNSILGPHEINSGYTRICGSNDTVVVYRKEEWLKVCIHECIHYFGIDFADVDQQIYVPLMKGIFNIVSDHLLYESYTEFWADMLFLCIYSIETHKNIRILIKKECIHSIQTCKKILQHMKLSYSDLLHMNRKNNTSLFREKTNVFCYYFLKTLYLFYMEYS